MKKTLFRRTILLCTAILLSTQAITTPYQTYAMASAIVNGETDNDTDKNDNTDEKEDNKNNAKEKGITIQIGKNKKIVEILKGSFVKKNGIKYFKKHHFTTFLQKE